MSMKLTPAAATSTSSWPGPGCGSGTSAASSTSGPPVRRTTIARMPTSCLAQVADDEQADAYHGDRDQHAEDRHGHVVMAPQRGHALSAYNAGFMGFEPAGAFAVAGIATVAETRWALVVPGILVTRLRPRREAARIGGAATVTKGDSRPRPLSCRLADGAPGRWRPPRAKQSAR